ncbi:hypothetical protein PENTCL1PPCAC_18792, partial [Pristionchus entomophagus]
ALSLYSSRGVYAREMYDLLLSLVAVLICTAMVVNCQRKKKMRCGVEQPTKDKPLLCKFTNRAFPEEKMRRTRYDDIDEGEFSLERNATPNGALQLGLDEKTCLSNNGSARNEEQKEE